MRKYALIAASIISTVCLYSCNNDGDKVEVNVKVAGIKGQQIYLEELGINAITIIDSAQANADGEAKLKASPNEPSLYRLRLPSDRNVLLVLDKGVVTVSGVLENIENYTVSGSDASESLRGYLENVRKNLTDINSLSIVMDSMHARKNDSLFTLARTEQEGMIQNFTKYIENYADSVRYLPNALFAVQMLNPASEKDYLEKFSNRLSQRFPKSAIAQDFTAKFKEMIAIADAGTTASENLKAGTVAPEISLNDINGKQVKLSDFRGQYVLVDFWASWCAPCRAENPNLVAAYEKMKSKNFTVLGVSLDNKKEKWLEGIKADGLNWTHISDLKGWESIAARDYSIQSIPSNFLIDPDGKIIARDLRGEELLPALESLIK